jgi:hypothetical protein
MGGRILIGLLALLWAGSVSAQQRQIIGYFSGIRLYQECISATALCSAVSAAVADTLSVLEVSGNIAPNNCRPGGTSADQLKAVVTRYLTNHPDLRQYSGVWLVMQAFAEAWPCSR